MLLLVHLDSQVLAIVWLSFKVRLAALLAGVGRSLSEVGAVMIVGGNSEGFTRDDHKRPRATCRWHWAWYC